MRNSEEMCPFHKIQPEKQGNWCLCLEMGAETATLGSIYNKAWGSFLGGKMLDTTHARPREACCQVERLRRSRAAAQIPSRFLRSSGAPGRRVRAVPEAG